MTAVKVVSCSVMPGNARTAASWLSDSVALPVAESMAAVSDPVSTPVAPSTARAWNSPSATMASGRDAFCTARHVPASTHRPPCNR